MMKLMIMNVGGPGSADKRKKEIVHQLDTQRPDVAFVSEFTWTAKTATELKLDRYPFGCFKTPPDIKYKYTGNTHAGILINPDRPIDDYPIQQKLLDESAYKIDPSFLPNTRLTIRKIRYRGEIDKSDYLFVAVHCHNTGYKESLKIKFISNIQKYIDEILRRTGKSLDVIVGGDFNLKSDNVILEDGWCMADGYTPTQLRKGKDLIDFILLKRFKHRGFQNCSNEPCGQYRLIGEIQALELIMDKSFDHDPLLTSVLQPYDDHDDHDDHDDYDDHTRRAVEMIRILLFLITL